MTLLVRQVDSTGDMVFGNSSKAFWRDVPDAVAQIAESRLGLWQGEWFLDITAGTPYRTRVLGNRTSATRDPTLRNRLLGTLGVRAIAAYSSVLDRDLRAYSVSATLDTIFGQATVDTTTQAPQNQDAYA